MEEYNVDTGQKVLSGVVMDSVVDNLITQQDKLQKQVEEKDEIIKRLRKEIMDGKKPKEQRLWVKVYKDTDISNLSLNDRGVLLSLCQLVDKNSVNKDGYLTDKKTGGIVTTWTEIGRNIGIGDISHSSDNCKTLIDKGILIVEPLNETSKKKRFRLNPYYVTVGKGG